MKACTYFPFFSFFSLSVKKGSRNFSLQGFCFDHTGLDVFSAMSLSWSWKALTVRWKLSGMTADRYISMNVWWIIQWQHSLSVMWRCLLQWRLIPFLRFCDQSPDFYFTVALTKCHPSHPNFASLFKEKQQSLPKDTNPLTLNKILHKRLKWYILF